MKRIHVVSGALDEEGLAGVLEAVGLMRQLTCLEVSSPLGAVEGILWMKSGQLLEATAGARTGLDALRYLIDRPGTYDVYRAEGKLDAGVKPMMPLADAVEQARAMGPEAPSVARATGMQPIGSASAAPVQPVTMGGDPPSPPARPVALTPEPPARPATDPPRVARYTPPAAPPFSPPPFSPPVHTPPPFSPPAAVAPPPAAPTPAPRPEHRTRVSVPAPEIPRPARPGARDAFATSNSGPVIAVFANKGGVGKTTFALNLAVTLARRGMRVTLVDADPRNDVGNALAARRDTSRGLIDVLDGSPDLEGVLLETPLPGFSILPAGGVDLPEERFQAALGRADRLSAVLATLSSPGSVVIVDTPPGLRGVTHSVLRASTHAVAVVQAEPIALRAAMHVPRALDALPARERPALVGVVLNMLDRRVGASLGMLEEACRVFGADNVLDIAIPRSGVFIEASENGAPVALMEPGGGHAVGWIFESLASAVLARAGLTTPRFAEMRLL